MTQPTAKQQAYMRDLVAKVAREEHMSQQDVLTSLGLYEPTMHGPRLRSEMVTKANVSRWIDTLRKRAGAEATS